MDVARWYLANVLKFVRVVIITLLICIGYQIALSDGKVFERCELAQLLRYGHDLDVNDVANWVCIAQHSSSLNTSAFGSNTKSSSHGIFQISDEYWCSPPGKGVACGVACNKLRDDDISDDFACVLKIYEEHQRLSGDGFNAWIAYQSFCKDNPYEYVEDCFGKEEREYLHSKSITTNYVEDVGTHYDQYSKDKGKVYGKCELAKELLVKHNMPMEQIPTWVCIAQHESNYDTSAVGRLNADGSADHGLFQISDLFWCSNKPGKKKACGVPCSQFLDSDITDDVKCIKKIYKEHTGISGDGFNAWTVYKAHCRDTTSKYIRGCFDGIDVEDFSVSESQKQESKPHTEIKHKPHGKVYDSCELADELGNKYHIPEDQIATWVCIAKHESSYNTSAIGHGDHGLFQISDIYWCSPPGKGWACGLSCEDLEDSDISDDVECIKKIYKEHTQLSGDGFKAWTVYPRFCSDGKAEKYISHCPSRRLQGSSTILDQTYLRPTNLNSVEEYHPQKSKIYGRCELAKELLTKHHIPMEEIPTWVCIASHESNFDTSAVGRLNADGSADHGLFQISDLYWCSHKGRQSKACGIPCSRLLDGDITDDVKCVKQIYEEHTLISGDGFNAWTVYNPYCKERVDEYTRGCFDGSASPDDFKPSFRKQETGFISKNKPKGKVYEECELAKELREKHHVPEDQISTWVCIAKHQTGLNTSVSVAGSHGMFLISDEFWCSPPGKGKACELHCSDLEDSDISDDVECVNKIYLEHQKLFGNGFNAWKAYSQYCNNGRANDYTGHCLGFESTRKNTFTFEDKKNLKFGSKSLDISNKQVFNHEFNKNPFLKHFETSTVATNYPSFVTKSIATRPEAKKEIQEDHEFISNPFLKYIKSDTKYVTTTPLPSFLGFQTTTSSINSNPFFNQFKFEKSTAPTKFTTSSPSTFNPFLNQFLSKKPTTPAPYKPYVFTTVPAKSSRLQVYQPSNEEKGKYEAFKAFVTPAPPPFTVTPKSTRLEVYQWGKKMFITTQAPSTQFPQLYQTNTFLSSLRQSLTTKSPTFKPFIPSTQIPTIQPQVYQKQSFYFSPTKLPQTTISISSHATNYFVAATTKPPLTTKSPSYKPLILPTKSTYQMKGTTKPLSVVTTTKLPLTFKNSGQYDSGKYDSGQYNSGKYNSGQYIAQEKKSDAKITAAVTKRPESWDQGKYDFSKPTNKPTTTSLTKSSPVWNQGLYKSQKLIANPSFTTKLPTKQPTVWNQGLYKPSLPGSTTSTATRAFPSFPSTTRKSTEIFASSKAVNQGFYVTSKPPITTKSSGQYSPNKSLTTPFPTTNKPTSFKTQTATRKSDPFNLRTSGGSNKTSLLYVNSNLKVTTPPKILTTTINPLWNNFWTSITPKITTPTIKPTSKSLFKSTPTPTKASTYFRTISSHNASPTGFPGIFPTTTKSPVLKTSTKASITSKPFSFNFQTTVKPNLTFTTKQANAPATSKKTVIGFPGIFPTTTKSPVLKTSTKASITSKPFSFNFQTTVKPNLTFTTKQANEPATSNKTVNPFGISQRSNTLPTKFEIQKSTNLSKVNNRTLAAVSATTTKKPITTRISQTKSPSSSETLFKSRNNIFDFYYNLYGVKPPNKTSFPGQTTNVPSNTS